MARHVLVPVASVWLIATAVVLTIASQSTEAAFDRALLDDALGLAASVVQRDGRLQIDLSAEELNAVLFDQSEVVYFAVRAADGTLVAGQNALRAEGLPSSRAVAFGDIDFQHQILRGVLLQREQPAAFSVVLAQTTQSRSAHWQRLLLYSLTPLTALLLLLGWWLGRAIERDLRPVAQLQDELNRRPAAELHPLAVPATTSDLDSLVRSVDGLMARLGTLVAAQREFSGTVAHELRTPLAGIRALAEFGLAHENPALWREQLTAIVQSQQRASRLVDQLLALALADEAHSAPVLLPLALDDLVRRVLLRTLPRADTLGADLGAEGIDDEVTVMGDPGLLEGALQNLLDNALRYGRPTDRRMQQRVTVDVSRNPADDTVTLAVTDNGPGIEVARQAQLLARWQQGEPGRQLGEGAGLGLAIVARYAHLLQAGLVIEAGPGGQGARVSLRLTPQAGGAVKLE